MVSFFSPLRPNFIIHLICIQLSIILHSHATQLCSISTTIEVNVKQDDNDNDNDNDNRASTQMKRDYGDGQVTTARYRGGD